MSGPRFLIVFYLSVLFVTRDLLSNSEYAEYI